MKNLLYFVLLFLIQFRLFGELPFSDHVFCGDSTLDILFIGNSQTYVNDIPKTVQNLAKSTGDSIYVEKSVKGGYDFQRHFRLEQTIDAIHSRKWDIVVLQENGLRASLPRTILDTVTFNYADSLILMIKTNNPETKIYFYMTHGYINGPKDCVGDSTHCSYWIMQDNIIKNYQDLSIQKNCPVAPAGIMWKKFKQKYPDVLLHKEDEVHARPAGSYISACTIFATITGKSPLGLYIPDDVDQSLANKIQELVDNEISK